jgi:hypothetical protein
MTRKGSYTLQIGFSQDTSQQVSKSVSRSSFSQDKLGQQIILLSGQELAGQQMIMSQQVLLSGQESAHQQIITQSLLSGHKSVGKQIIL